MTTLPFPTTAEASAATEQARQFAEKAEEEKDALRKEIVSLHARLDSRRSPDGSSRDESLANVGGDEGSLEEEGGTSFVEDTLHLKGVRAASSARHHGHVSQQDVNRDMLSAVLSDFNTQLANNYAQVRTVLHQVPLPPRGTFQTGAAVVDAYLSTQHSKL